MVANEVAILLEVAVAHVKKVGRGSLPVRTANISLVTVTNTTHTERFAQQKLVTVTNTTKKTHTERFAQQKLVTVTNTTQTKYVINVATLNATAKVGCVPPSARKWGIATLPQVTTHVKELKPVLNL